MSMIAMPSIVMLSLMAMLSMVAATILSKRWMRYVALACAVIEVIAVGVLVFTSLSRH